MPGNVRARKYRHLINIGRAERKRDAAGQVQYIYPTKTTWAEVIELSGSEQRQDAENQLGVTTRVTMRWRDDVTAKDRIYHGGRELGIVNYGDREGFKREIVCDCKEIKT